MTKNPIPRIATTSKTIRFAKGPFHFRELISDEGLKQAFQLRYEICVEQMKWVDGDPSAKLEYDEFDEHSFHFGCYDGEKLVGYLRMTKENSPSGTMSRKYFSHLWHKDPQFPVEQTADLSRLIVRRSYLKNRKHSLVILLGLYRLAYGRSELCRPQVRYWYFITSPRLMTGLKWRFGFPVKKLGEGITSDGKRTLVGSLDLEHGLRQQFVIAPWRFHYFHQAKKHLG